MRRFFTANAFAPVTLVVLIAMGVAVLTRFNRNDTGYAVASTAAGQPAAGGPRIYTINSLTPVPIGTGVPMPTSNATQIANSHIAGSHVLTPPVTDAGIRALLADPARQGLVNGTNVVVTGVQFMTVSQAYAIVRDPFLNNFPPDEPVAHVTLTGDFVNDAPIAMHYGYAIFDVQTGNILMGAELPTTPAPAAKP